MAEAGVPERCWVQRGRIRRYVSFLAVAEGEMLEFVPSFYLAAIMWQFVFSRLVKCLFPLPDGVWVYLSSQRSEHVFCRLKRSWRGARGFGLDYACLRRLTTSLGKTKLVLLDHLMALHAQQSAGRLVRVNFIMFVGHKFLNVPACLRVQRARGIALCFTLVGFVVCVLFQVFGGAAEIVTAD